MPRKNASSPKIANRTLWEQRRDKSIDKLLDAVRTNRRGQTELLDYLKDYCQAAWRLGWEARDRDAKREAA